MRFHEKPGSSRAFFMGFYMRGSLNTSPFPRSAKRAKQEPEGR